MHRFLFVLLTFWAGVAAAATFHVATDGADSNPGSAERPWQTLQKAADAMQPGDTCLIHAGTYRQTLRPSKSGQPGRPIRFVAAPGELVTLSGARIIQGPTSAYRDSIRQIRCDVPVNQLFLNGKMMVEARWPNMTMDQLWQRSCWATTAKGSRYGKILDPALTQTQVDWTGALAVLNVAHQFLSWTRPVSECSPGEFEYPQTLEGITHFANSSSGWSGNRYYLTGKLEALDSPGEWFYDPQAKLLYFWPPNGVDLGHMTVEIKDHDWGVEVKDHDWIELQGLHFFACSFHFENCNHCTVDGCRLLYPLFARHLSEPPFTDDEAEIALNGDSNTVRNSVIALSQTGALRLNGRHNHAENNLIHDTCWNGSLRYPALSVINPGGPEDGAVVRHNTVYNGGSVLIHARGRGNLIEYNHVYRGGLACKDVSLIYTAMPECAGTIIRYNWVHGCHNDDFRGLGIRGDDQSRSLTIHHNVVWDCGWEGIIVKGDSHEVYNNTIFDIGSEKRAGNYIDLPISAEPKKWWRNDQFNLLPVQNAHSKLFNNAAQTICSSPTGKPMTSHGCITRNNWQKGDLRLIDPDHFDFRPRPDSPLVDAGVPIPGITDGFKGKAPDIGAYESGADRWVAGCQNLTDSQTTPPSP